MTGVLDIVALRSLTAIADAGGFRRAAEAMHLSQSAVSQHVRRLEQACGRALVERHGRGARFTAEGELLLAEARKILAAHDDAIMKLRAEVDAAAPEVAVGSIEHAADVLLPVITERLQRRLRDHEIRFRIDRGATLRDRVDRGLLDAALLFGADEDERSTAAGALPLRWYAAAGTTVALSTTRPVPLVVIEGPCTVRRRAIATLDAEGIASTIVCEAGHLAGVHGAVRAGVGVALLAGAGPGPEGLVEITSLPAAEPEPLAVLTRPGARDDLGATVAGAVRARLGTAFAVSA